MSASFETEVTAAAQEITGRESRATSESAQISWRVGPGQLHRINDGIRFLVAKQELARAIKTETEEAVDFFRKQQLPSDAQIVFEDREPVSPQASFFRVLEAVLVGRRVIREDAWTIATQYRKEFSGGSQGADTVFEGWRPSHHLGITRRGTLICYYNEGSPAAPCTPLGQHVRASERDNFRPSFYDLVDNPHLLDLPKPSEHADLSKIEQSWHQRLVSLGVRLLINASPSQNDTTPIAPQTRIRP